MDRLIPCQRQADEVSQSPKGAIVAPERHHLPDCKHASLPTKTSQDFGWSTSAGRVAATDQRPRRVTWHTWEGALVAHPENRAAGTGEAMSHSDHARQTPGHLSCSDLGKAQNTGPIESAPLRGTRIPEPEWLRPGKCKQPRASLRQFPTEQPRAQAVLKGKAHSPWAGANSVWPRQCITCQCYLFGTYFPPYSTTEQVSWKKCPPPPLVSGQKLDTEETSKQKKLKQTEGTALEVTSAID